MKNSLGTGENIEKVVLTHSKRLLCAAYSILKSTALAEDAVQETFIKLLTNQPKFKDAEHEKAWLLRVTINVSINMLKKSERERCTAEVELIKDDDYSCYNVLEAVLSLPVQYRTVIHLYYYEGYSIKEMASLLKMSAATVGTRLARARKILKKILTQEEQTWL